MRAGNKLAGMIAHTQFFFSLAFLPVQLSNPHYRPEIAAQCTLINHIVTEDGLEEQLLALVVNKEKPELEEKRTALVRAINDYVCRTCAHHTVLLQLLLMLQCAAHPFSVRCLVACSPLLSSFFSSLFCNLFSL